MKLPWSKKEPIRTGQAADDMRRMIREFGWQVTLVSTEIPFGYTIGISSTFGQPELMIAGLRLEDIHGLCNDYGARIRDGWKPQVGEILPSWLSGNDAILFPILDEYKPHFMGIAVDEFETTQFPALQAVWSVDNAYPFQSGWPEHLKGKQFLLSQPENWPEVPSKPS